jgi:hypothetical protein
LNSAYLFCLKAIEVRQASGRIGFVLPKSLYYSSTWGTARETMLPLLEHTGDVSVAFKDVKLEEVVIVLAAKNHGKKVSTACVEGERIVETQSIDRSVFERTKIIFAGYSKADVEISEHILDTTTRADVELQVKRGFLIQNLLSDQARTPVLRCKTIRKFGFRPVTDFIGASDAKSVSAENPWLKDSIGVIQNIVAHVTKPIDQIILMAAPGTDTIGLDNVSYMLPRNKNWKGRSPMFVALFNSWFTSWYMYRFCYSKAIRTIRFDNYHLNKMALPKVLVESLARESALLKSAKASIEASVEKQLVALRKKVVTNPFDIEFDRVVLENSSVALGLLGERLVESPTDATAGLLCDALVMQLYGLEKWSKHLSDQYQLRSKSGIADSDEAEELEQVG